MNRYNRHIILEEIGWQGQTKLNRAKVLVVGTGGLGCPVLQYLAAAGIGTLGIIDHDVVEESNLQRQVLFGTSTIGMNKALAAKKRLTDLNDTITINAYPEALTTENAESIFEEYSIIVDGTDNFPTRYLINDTAVRTHKVVVYGAIYKFEGQVSVFNYRNGPNYRCLFPSPPNEKMIPNCSDVGVLGVLPGIIGCMQANEVIKIILGFENILSGKLYCYNAQTTQSSILNFEKNEVEYENILARKNHVKEDYKIENCEADIREIGIQEALQKENVIFIDVREPDEKPEIKGFPYLQIPIHQLISELHAIDNSKTIVFFCKSENRSKKAVSLLREHNINNCFSLKDGADAIINHLNIHTP